MKTIKPYFCHMPLLIGSVGLLSLVIAGIATGQTILFAFALATLSVGFGISSLLVALRTDRVTNELRIAIERMENMQEQMRKAQEEQPGSGKPLIATLQGLSQYYFDYMAKKKDADE